jgi:hypothetical protein
MGIQAALVGTQIIKGRATIKGGQLFELVTDPRVGTHSRIVVTGKLTAIGAVAVTNQVHGSFRLTIGAPAGGDTDVDYAIHN